MARKRHTDEDCLKILRQVELDLAGGADVVKACRSAGISDATYVSVHRATSGSFEVPGQERIDIFVWPSLSDAFEGLRKPAVRIYIV